MAVVDIAGEVARCSDFMRTGGAGRQIVHLPDKGARAVADMLLPEGHLQRKGRFLHVDKLLAHGVIQLDDIVAGCGYGQHNAVAGVVAFGKDQMSAALGARLALRILYGNFTFIHCYFSFYHARHSPSGWSASNTTALP